MISPTRKKKTKKKRNIQVAKVITWAAPAEVIEVPDVSDDPATEKQEEVQQEEVQQQGSEEQQEEVQEEQEERPLKKSDLMYAVSISESSDDEADNENDPASESSEHERTEAAFAEPSECSATEAETTREETGETPRNRWRMSKEDFESKYGARLPWRRHMPTFARNESDLKEPDQPSSSGSNYSRIRGIVMGERWQINSKIEKGLEKRRASNFKETDENPQPDFHRDLNMAAGSHPQNVGQGNFMIAHWCIGEAAKLPPFIELLIKSNHNPDRSRGRQ